MLRFANPAACGWEYIKKKHNQVTVQKNAPGELGTQLTTAPAYLKVFIFMLKSGSLTSCQTINSSQRFSCELSGISILYLLLSMRRENNS